MIVWPVFLISIFWFYCPFVASLGVRCIHNSRNFSGVSSDLFCSYLRIRWNYIPSSVKSYDLFLFVIIWPGYGHVWLRGGSLHSKWKSITSGKGKTGLITSDICQPLNKFGVVINTTGLRLLHSPTWFSVQLFVQCVVISAFLRISWTERCNWNVAERQESR